MHAFHFRISHHKKTPDPVSQKTDIVDDLSKKTLYCNHFDSIFAQFCSLFKNHPCCPCPSCQSWLQRKTCWQQRGDSENHGMTKSLLSGCINRWIWRRVEGFVYIGTIIKLHIVIWQVFLIWKAELVKSPLQSYPVIWLVIFASIELNSTSSEHDMYSLMLESWAGEVAVAKLYTNMIIYIHI